MMSESDYVRAIFAGTGINENDDAFQRAIQLLHIYANEKVSEIIDDIAYDEYYEHVRFTHVYSANRNGDKDKTHKAINALQDGMHNLATQFSDANNEYPELIALIQNEWDRYVKLSQEKRTKEETERKHREYDALPWYKKLTKSK